MPSPKWRSALPTRRVAARFQKDPRIQYGLIGAALALCFVFLSSVLHRALPVPFLSMRELELLENPPSTNLFIAIGSAPANAGLREAARRSWLRWLPDDGSVSYRFFTDAAPTTADDAVGSRDMWKSLAAEARMHGDVVRQPIDGGYGDKEHNAYGLRARYQARWAATRFTNMSYFLRVDDDGFLCLHKLLYELKSAPRSQFFWGRYWCRESRNRADESFMLFSDDVARFVADDTLLGKIVPFDDGVTFGWNFGYLSWVLNLTIFDDQKRIDSQQGYLTEYMHAEKSSKEAGGFCEAHVFAHHVRAETMVAAYEGTKTHMLYNVPARTPPTETCSIGNQSFLPARHSARLPDVFIRRSNPS